MRPQRTLARPVRFEGVGVHAGTPATVTVAPAPADHGLVFVRTDCAGARIPARLDRVVDTRNATKLGDGAGLTVSTGEHVLAALSGLEIDNARIEVDGAELPILDGAAGAYVAAFEAAGLVAQGPARRAIHVRRPVEIVDGRRRGRLEPAGERRFTALVRYAEAAIGEQTATVALSPAVFAAEVAPARTFGLAADLERLHAAGLARGAALDNTLAFGPTGPLNPGAWPNEPARHKLLDMIGDFALAGAPVVGHYRAEEPGHGLNIAVLKALLTDPEAWEWGAAP